jgi:hypothetical protein
MAGKGQGWQEKAGKGQAESRFESGEAGEGRRLRQSETRKRTGIIVV